MHRSALKQTRMEQEDRESWVLRQDLLFTSGGLQPAASQVSVSFQKHEELDKIISPSHCSLSALVLWAPLGSLFLGVSFLSLPGELPSRAQK